MSDAPKLNWHFAGDSYRKAVDRHNNVFRINLDYNRPCTDRFLVEMHSPTVGYDNDSLFVELIRTWDLETAEDYAARRSVELARFFDLDTKPEQLDPDNPDEQAILSEVRDSLLMTQRTLLLNECSLQSVTKSLPLIGEIQSARARLERAHSLVKSLKDAKKDGST